MFNKELMGELLCTRALEIPDVITVRFIVSHSTDKRLCRHGYAMHDSVFSDKCFAHAYVCCLPILCINVTHAG